jgi:hypothetical protein
MVGVRKAKTVALRRVDKTIKIKRPREKIVY